MSNKYDIWTCANPYKGKEAKRDKYGIPRCMGSIKIAKGTHPDGWSKEMPAAPNVGLPFSPCLCPNCQLGISSGKIPIKVVAWSLPEDAE